MTDAYTETRTRAPASAGAHEAPGTATAVSGAARDAAATVRDQGGQVAHEVKQQARNLTAETRDRVREQARNQNDRLADSVRRVADELDEMARDRGDSPAGTMVAKVAAGGRRVADHLAERGPEGLLSEVQEFARRRPGAFLATALVSGFVVGRLGKGIFGTDPASDPAPGPDRGPTDRPEPGAADRLTTPGMPAAAPPVPAVDSAATAIQPQYDPSYPATSGYPASPAAGPAPAVSDDVAVGAAPVPPQNYAPPTYPAAGRPLAEDEQADPVRYRPGTAP